jgi:glycosyltransferase involved in cell wall biosynthesis/Tfp pilus assembly protein PilF
MIVRDEEPVLARAIASVRQYVDELVIVDTGSEDDTVAIAEAQGARVGHFAWDDNFADARNAALGLVTADWVLVLDADEELESATAMYLRRVVRAGTDRFGPICFALPVRSWWIRPDASGRSSTVHKGGRVFRKLPGVAWVGEIHETIAIGDGKTMTYADTDVPTIVHHGYATSRDVLARKGSRNLEILQRAYARNHADGYYAYKLAQHAISEHKRDEAKTWLRRSIAEASTTAEPARFIVAATDIFAKLLIEDARERPVRAATRALLDEAEVAIVRAVAHYPHATPLWLRLAESAAERGDLAVAARTYASILSKAPDNAEALIGYASAMRDRPAVVLQTLDRHIAAHGQTDTVSAWRGELLRTIGRVQEAYDYLDSVVRAHPEFREARMTLASLLDQEGAPAEAVHILSSMLDATDVPVLVYEILGRALTRMGQSDAAMDALTIVAARKAEAVPAVD